MTEITLLDGGMGQELIKRSGGVATPLWSTQALIDRPGLVAEVHADYADAGATVATTDSYALHRDRLRGGESNHYAKEGVELPDMEAQLPDLIAAALEEAQGVRDRSRIAGSVGPLGASYRSDLNPPFEEAVRLYGEVAGMLAPGVDILLFETIASVEAGETCLAAGRTTDRPVWLSYTIDDEDGTRLRSGEPLEEVLATAAQADAVLVNCSAPEVIPQALGILSRAGVPFGAYANGFTQITKAFLDGGTTVDGLSPRRELTPAVYADHAMGWVRSGATLVGGCCEVGPDHISEIARRLREAGHTLV